MDTTYLEQSGLVLADASRPLPADSRALARDVARGLLVKLRRGAYVPTPTWEAATARERHVLRIHAVVAASPEPLVVAGESAGALWGIPIAGAWSDDVLLLDRWRGGGRREPGVRHTSVRADKASTATIDGITVTTLSRTLLDIARATSFVNAVGSVDWGLWRNNPCRIAVNELVHELAVFEGARSFRHLERIVAFATDLSDSFGESEARAAMFALGFVVPKLQVTFRDSEGSMFPDFFWPTGRIAAEFDGKHKYTRNQFTNGDPGEVVWREKKREDRLRRQVSSVARILTSDVKIPTRLERILVEAGAPGTSRRAGGETDPWPNRRGCGRRD